MLQPCLCRFHPLPLPRNRKLILQLSFAQKEQNILNVPLGFGALGICSAVHVSGIDEQTAKIEEAGITAALCDFQVDYVERSVTGCMKNDPAICTKAIWRAGIGWLQP